MSSDSPIERGRLINGKIILLATAIGMMLVPVAVWGTLRWVESRTEALPPLSWEQRDQWPGLPIKAASLRRSQSSTAYSGKQFRDPGFHPSPELATTLTQLSVLAGGDQFTSPATRKQIEAIVTAFEQEHPDEPMFYGQWLLGHWYTLASQQDEADRYFEQAFAAAPVTLIQPYANNIGRAQPNLAVGTMGIALDQVIDDTLVPGIVLVYPDLVTDKHGRVFMPIYESVYRIEQQAHRAGISIRYAEGEYFKTHARIGTLKPAIVKPVQ